MGIGDRAYMRDSSSPPSKLTDTARTLLILLGFGLVGLIDWSTRAKGYSVTDPLGLNNQAPQAWQWLTYGLIHGGVWHFFMNALALWWLGGIVEQSYGRKVYWQTLLAGTLVGALTWWLTGTGGLRDNTVLVGISAGVYALMVVALMDRLESTVTLLIIVFPVTIKARWLLLVSLLFAAVGWLFLELPGRHAAWTFWKPAWDMNRAEAIAHSAHLGGLLAGWVLWRYLGRIIPEAGGAYIVQSQPKASVTTQAMPANPAEALSPNQARAELDQLLDKISAKGFGSLTASEKRKLEELSARLR